ncbi:hypothetical protein JTE90_010532 [Oedothorax gibbosus]|uniref:Uncharacterized protein n=1 Tax=Oedothorax gibbosus TaxID=931172 RepID=A0AAV6TSZ7_9ARAC|nr:hypothetical protein JTE90_010532 [Oedothorax gibbosus]
MGDDCSESPSSKRGSVKNYVSRVWKESSVSAVSAIVSTGSVPRKVFRVLVFVLFTAGFLYQCIKFLTYVYSYPTIVNIEIKKPDFYLAPAYTFCNYNIIKRSKFCHKYPEKCIIPDEKFCQKYSSYCGENGAKVPKEEYFLSENYPTEGTFDFGHDVDSILKMKMGVEEDEEASGPYPRIRKEGLNSLSSCYSFYSRVNSPLEPLMKMRNVWWEKSSQEFVFDPEEREVFSPNERPGVVFAIHSPFEAVNPFEKGIFLRPGYSYRITISMHEEKLLPYPYETDCVNYTEVWLSNNREGPRSQKSCQDYCVLETSIYCFNCVHPMVTYPSETRTCSVEDILSSPCVNTSAEQYGTADKVFYICFNKCKDDCFRMKYTYDVSEIYEVPEWTKEENNKKSRLIKVAIDFEDSEIIALHYRPQFQEVEAFSYIGGFIGIWLGVSLVQIADVFESLFRIARYFCKKGASVCCRKSTASKNEEV